MKIKKLNLMLVVLGLAFPSGCATSGLKMPFADKFASLKLPVLDSKIAGSSSKEELSPEFKTAQKVFKKDPERTLLAWARWQEDVGEYGEARQKYRELLIAYPDNIDAQLGLARIELACGRVQQSEDILLEAAKKLPTNAPVRLELGRLYTQQEDWPKAVASFEDASAIDPANQVCRYELGVVFARVHRYDQALSHLTYAVGESAANYNIGYVLHEQGHDTEAAQWFQNALESHPDTRTAGMTNSILAKISPLNLRDRNNSPVYPSSRPSDEFLARRSKQTAMDQYEPASLEEPVVRGSDACDNQQREQQLPPISNVSNSTHYSESSVQLPPVNPEVHTFGNTNQPEFRSASPLGAGQGHFKTVSHTMSHESMPPATTLPDNRPPQWHGAGQAMSTSTKVRDATPGKWRSQ